MTAPRLVVPQANKMQQREQRPFPRRAADIFVRVHRVLNVGCNLYSFAATVCHKYIGESLASGNPTAHVFYEF